MIGLKSTSIMSRFRDVPLKYRLSIPFFFLAFLGTSSLVFLAILSQNDLIRREERDRLYGYNRAFSHNVELQGQWAVSLASNLARNPEVAHALADRDRLRLIQLCYPAYLFMKKNYGISQFNFHSLPPHMFLRLQRLYEFGDDLEYRQTILDALSDGRETFGLELGLTGYGIRGVAPVFYEGNVVGSIEIGFSFGVVFLEQMKKQFGIEASFLVPDESGAGYKASSTTFPKTFVRTDPVYAQVFHSGEPQLLIRQIQGRPYTVLVRSVEDYQGKTVALAEFCVDRTETLTIMDHYRQLMLGIGFLGMILSVGAIYVISAYFTRPIGKMVSFAREIAKGDEVRPLAVRPSGELAILSEALDEMLLSLKRSREKIEHYANNLEEMVHSRTRALRESEEKYRTLVERVPLTVYRLLGDGRMVFVNHFIEDILGLPMQDVVENPNFWKEKVWEEDRPRVWPLMDRCLNEGCEFKAEYRVRHMNGNLLFVLDHALPVLDEKGNVETVDGIMVNVTDRHRLQQQIIQTEEMRTLSEVSARLAHEIRNPLVAAGGFARRLLQSLPEGDPNQKKVEIVVQEVSRLEKILEKTLAYLRPFEVSLERHSLNELVLEVLEACRGSLEEHQVNYKVNLAPDLPPIPLDRDLFGKGLETLVLALIGYSQGDKCLELRTYSLENAVHLEITLGRVQISADDIEHFFYPFTTRADFTKSLDLPLAKMIIHKHQGVIHLSRRNSDYLVMNISLPL